MASKIQPPAKQGDDGFLTGKLLIAMPGMQDKRFEKSVIFMCSHNASGALGLIVNKPVESLFLRDLLTRMDIATTAATPSAPVMFGGPVDTDHGYVLHDGAGKTNPGSLAVTAQIALTPTVDMLRLIAAGSGPAKFLMALGYSGWGPGQIESEIVANGWIHCDADDALVFGGDAAAKWQRALAKLGVGISGFSSEMGRA